MFPANVERDGMCNTAKATLGVIYDGGVNMRCGEHLDESETATLLLSSLATHFFTSCGTALGYKGYHDVNNLCDYSTCSTRRRKRLNEGHKSNWIWNETRDSISLGYNAYLTRSREGIWSTSSLEMV